jgi:hypothetical protein
MGSGPFDQMSSVVDSLREFLDSFESSPNLVGDEEELFELFSEIEREAKAVKLLAVRRVEKTGWYQKCGYERVDMWLAAVTSEPLDRAVAELEEAKAVESNPDVDSAGLRSHRNKE